MRGLWLSSQGCYVNANGQESGLEPAMGPVRCYGPSVSIALVPPVSIEARPLLRMVVRSQTYYSEHILAYGSGKARYALVMGSGSFRTD